MKKNIIKAAAIMILSILSFSVNTKNTTNNLSFGSLNFVSKAFANTQETEPSVRCACSVFGHRCKARRGGAYCGAAPCAEHSDTNC